MQTTTYRFEVVKVKGCKSWKDAEGNRHKKTKTFYQTINPFNVGCDGVIKTREQIHKELCLERAAWESEPEQK